MERVVKHYFPTETCLDIAKIRGLANEKGKCIEFTEGDEDRKGKRKPQLTTKIQIFKSLCLQLFSLAVFAEVKLGCERKTHTD